LSQQENSVSSIIAGRFESFDQAAVAVEVLVSGDVKRDDLSVFFVNPPGQHDVTPIGGDYIDADPGARESSANAVQGAAAGGVVGLVVGVAAAALPIVGAAAAVAAIGVGAYTGSLAGGLSGAGDGEHPSPPPRQAGVFVAVRVEDNERTQRAIAVLKANEAQDIEIADGTWRDGEWTDFDPVAPPRLIHWPVSTV
jgi:hypothetical protein